MATRNGRPPGILGPILAAAVVLVVAGGDPARGDVVLNFSDVPAGTLVIIGPYASQGFTLASSSGGFVFNSPTTGNGSPQVPAGNPFYAGSDGLAAFTPGTITLSQATPGPFSLLSIDLAREFASDPGPTVTFTGTLAAGGTVSQSFTVTTTSPPLAFQTFNLTGFTGLSSVSWTQGAPGQGIHQFGNIHLLPSAVPEPSSLVLLAAALPAFLAGGLRMRRRGEIVP